MQRREHLSRRTSEGQERRYHKPVRGKVERLDARQGASREVEVRRVDGQEEEPVGAFEKRASLHRASSRPDFWASCQPGGSLALRELRP